MTNKHPAFIGLLQAAGVIFYILLISLFMSGLENIGSATPEILAIILVLTLLVLSAAVCGSLVFGYPILLAFNKKIKEAVKVLASTFLFMIIFVAVYILILSQI
ncbi:MAG: hypothetical protein ABIH21_05310 [Patescibacteria group bacterium]